MDTSTAVSMIICLGVIFQLLPQPHAGNNWRRNSFSRSSSSWGGNNRESNNYGQGNTMNRNLGFWKSSDHGSDNYDGPNYYGQESYTERNRNRNPDFSRNEYSDRSWSSTYGSGNYRESDSYGQGVNNKRLREMEPRPIARTYSYEESATSSSRQRKRKEASKRCSIDISNIAWNHAWLVHPVYKTIVYPMDGTTIMLEEGAELMLACPGEQGGQENYLDFLYRKPSMAIVSCNNGEMTYLGHPLDQSSYGCLAPPKSYSRKTQILCYDKLHMYKVGFWHPTAERIWTNLYDVCVDDTEPQLIKTKYVIHTIQKGVAFRQEYSRFMNHKTQVDIIFKDKMLDPKDFYNEKSQIKSLQKQMSRRDFDALSLNVKIPIFNRGHLAPKSDFLYRAEQLATFKYINTSPQWALVNVGNYGLMESSIRRLAESAGPLKIYTGTLGNLEYEKGKIFLNKDPPTNVSMPVPDVFFKIVHIPTGNQAVALICHNKIIRVKAICKQITHSIAWLHHRSSMGLFNENPNKGICYACKVSDFLKLDKYLLPENRNDLNNAFLLQQDLE